MIEKKLNAVVIEDEKLSRERLVRLLKEDSRVRLIGEFESNEQVED